MLYRDQCVKSSSNVSLPFAWITGPATDPSFDLMAFHWIRYRNIIDSKLFRNILAKNDEIFSYDTIELEILASFQDLNRSSMQTFFRHWSSFYPLKCTMVIEYGPIVTNIIIVQNKGIYIRFALIFQIDV